MNHHDTPLWPTQDNPMLIALEGLDGSGKSTLARRIAELSGARCLTTPSPRVREFRNALLEDFGPSQEAAQLFYMATVFAASHEISLALASGESIVIDRYFLSTQAYAEFRGSGLDLDPMSAMLRRADLTIYVDAPLALRRERIGQRGASEADLETLAPEADDRLRRLHLDRKHLQVVGRFAVVDSSELSVDQCAEQVRIEAWRVAPSVQQGSGS